MHRLSNFETLALKIAYATRGMIGCFTSLWEKEARATAFNTKYPIIALVA